MAVRMRRGELPYPSDDVAADRYLAAEQALRAGFGWYEVSNWAARAGGGVPAQPALLDRRGLVGARPGGAQSHRRGALVERQTPLGVRRTPGRRRLTGARREILTDEDRHVEDVMLRVRLPRGSPLARWTPVGRPGRRSPTGCSTPAAYAAGRVVLTLRGRLLADAVIRDVLP